MGTNVNCEGIEKHMIECLRNMRYSLIHIGEKCSKQRLFFHRYMEKRMRDIVKLNTALSRNREQVVLVRKTSRKIKRLRRHIKYARNKDREASEFLNVVLKAGNDLIGKYIYF